MSQTTTSSLFSCTAARRRGWNLARGIAPTAKTGAIIAEAGNTRSNLKEDS